MPEIISRREAHERGFRRFYSGALCSRGHDSERYVSNGACIDCVNWKTPSKKVMNALCFWPPKGYGFGNAAGGPASAKEAEAVFRWIEAAGWHLRALEILRADPELMARFDHEWTNVERAATGRSEPDPRPTITQGS